MQDRPAILPQERRRYPRTSRSESASIVIGEWPERLAYDCQLFDLSDIGAAIEARNLALVVGQTTTLRIRTKAAPTPGAPAQTYPLTGTVVRNGAPNQYGLRFSPTVPEQIREIEMRPRKIMAGI